MQRSGLINNRTRLNKRSRARAYTSHLVTMPAGYNLQPVWVHSCHSSWTRVEPWCESCRLLARWPGDWCTQQHVTTCSTMFDWERGPNAASLFGLKPVVQKTTRYGPIAVIHAFIRTKWRFWWHFAYKSHLTLVGRSRSARVRLGLKEEGSVSVFSDQYHSTHHHEDYSWWKFDFRLNFPFNSPFVLLFRQFCLQFKLVCVCVLAGLCVCQLCGYVQVVK